MNIQYKSPIAGDEATNKARFT